MKQTQIDWIEINSKDPELAALLHDRDLVRAELRHLQWVIRQLDMQIAIQQQMPPEDD